MDLVFCKTGYSNDAIVTREVHVYTRQEEEDGKIENYRQLWENAGFRQIRYDVDKDNVYVMYTRRLERRLVK